MRIIQYIDSLSLGGAERMAVNISNALAEQGHEVLLITSRKQGAMLSRLSPKVQWHCLHKNSFFDLPAFFRFLKIIHRFRPELLHAHSMSVYWAIIAKKISFSTFILLFHDHFGGNEELKDKEDAYLKYLSSGIDRVIAVNQFLKQWCTQHLKVKPDNIHYIPNFPMLAFKERSKQQGTAQVLCLANLRSQKDHQTLIRAFAQLRKKATESWDQEIKLLLAGQAWGDVYQRDLEDLIHSLGLNDAVHLYGAVNEVESLLFSADIGVLSSVSEGLPVSLLEYGLAGLPAVVTEVGQCAEVLGHGKYGLLVPPQNPEALAAAMESLLRHPQDAKQMGEAFRHHVEEHYGAHGFLKAYYALLGPEIMQAEKM